MPTPPTHVLFSQVAPHFGSPDSETFGAAQFTPIGGNPYNLGTGCPSCGGYAVLVRSAERVAVTCAERTAEAGPSDRETPSPYHGCDATVMDFSLAGALFSMATDSVVEEHAACPMLIVGRNE